MNQLPVREAAAEPAAAATQNPNNIVSSFGIRGDSSQFCLPFRMFQFLMLFLINS